MKRRVSSTGMIPHGAGRRRLLAASPLLAAATAGGRASAGIVAPLADATVPLPGARSFALRSRAGLDYCIFVAEPVGSAPARGRPMLFFPDGNAYFGTAAGLLRLQPMLGGTGGAPLIVGIGYPGDAVLDRERRTFDLVPVPTGLGAAEHERLGARAGGADAFLDFLLAELVPVLAAQYVVDRQRLSLAGHSLGGLFALHALLRRPGAFHSIAAISPAIWVNEPGLLGGVETLARQAPPRLPAAVLLAVARNEVPSHPERSAAMLAGARAMLRRLQALRPHGLRARLVELAEENHMTTFFCTLPAILRQAGMALAHPKEKT